MSYTRRMKRSRRTKWVDRQIDQALLGIAMQAGFLYAHRRARRALPKVALGAVVVTGVKLASPVERSGNRGAALTVLLEKPPADAGASA